MSKEVTWKVFEEEKEKRKWVEIQHPLIGTPLFEHATDYISELENGSRVMVRKKDNFVYRNGSDDSIADEETVKELRKRAAEKSKALRKRRRMILY